MKKSVKKFTAMLLSLTVGLSLVNTGTVVCAQETTNELPDTTQFATVDELKSFNTDDSDGEAKSAKVYFGRNNQKWWIAGSQQEQGLTLFAASSLSKERFEPNQNVDTGQVKEYFEDYDCTYNIIDGNIPNSVYNNHYGISPIRASLKGFRNSYFSTSERALVNDTTIYTDDTLNNRVYSTTDKLYLAYGCYDDTYITVGKNTPESLNGGLKVDEAYWVTPDDLRLWLRAPEKGKNGRNQALSASRGRPVYNITIQNTKELVPALELDISTVGFASAALAASSDGDLALQDTDGDGAFTLRYEANNLGSAVVSYNKEKVKLTGVPSGTYLVVQNRDGAIAKQITNELEVSASDMSHDSFANCKVWLETTVSNERMTYATLATEELGFNVTIDGSEGLTVINGVQGVGQGSAIADITVGVSEGYYLPDGYISNLQGQLNNGLSVTKTDEGFTISGVPTSDVNVTLPAASVLPKADKPEVTISKTTSSITATVTNHKTEFGDIEYKWNGGNWEKDKNELSGLEAGKTYKLAVRFTGNKGIYKPSEEYSVDITTLVDGNDVIKVPTVTPVPYEEGLTLSKVKLNIEGWTWVDDNITLSAGTNLYSIAFDTTELESKYDFSGVAGYDANKHRIIRSIELTVDKANPVVKDVKGLVITQGQSLSSVKLPKGYAWVDGSVVVSELGEYTFKVKYTPEDTDNYNVLVLDIKVKVVAKPVTTPTPEATVKPTPEAKPQVEAFKAPVYDDGGPFTTDECGSVYDRWGNLMWKAPSCKAQVNDGYSIVNTSDK